MSDERRPGGWVEGIGWVAWLHDLPLGTSFSYFPGDGYTVSENTAECDPAVVIVDYWPNTAKPVPAPPADLYAGRAEWRALVAAAQLRGLAADAMVSQKARALVAAAALSPSDTPARDLTPADPEQAAEG